ncbi:MAG: hypothetical protein KVP17_000833 [Porospora cf. gigantea B]|uniref:uncharacterized protein n=1 Tax=Porospora cf. gigantea B TaxID=2853592 RepID=UPI003571F5AB|nr:MAG: hypothetical protein KVP17_000833 [Porospora cf. gigantea B]
MWRALTGCAQGAGTYVLKFLQWAGTRADLFPEYFVRGARNLQMHVPPEPLPYTLLTLEKVLNSSAEIDVSGAILFDTNQGRLVLEPVPVGSGCVAQVHKGRLYNLDGTSKSVALKVHRYEIAENMQSDIRGLQLMSNAASRMLGNWGTYLCVKEATDQFAVSMLQQLDLSREKRQTEILSGLFKSVRSRWNFWVLKGGVQFPDVIDFSPSKEVLFEEYLDGMSLVDFLDNSTPVKFRNCWRPRKQTVRIQVARLLLRTFLQMVFEDNFVHADLHPGNLKIKVRERRWWERVPRVTVQILDASSVVRLDARDRQNLLDLLQCVVSGNGAEAGRLIIERSSRPIPKNEEFCAEIAEIVTLYYRLRSGLTLDDVRINDVITRLLKAACQHKVELDPHFVQLCLATMVFEGTVRQLYPDMDLLTEAVPFILKAQLRAKRGW